MVQSVTRAGFEDKTMTKAADQESLSSPKPKTVIPASNSGSCVNPERWVQEYGHALFGFAALRVLDRAIAQDLVQETFLAAIKARHSFGGRSTERAWLCGILRH